MALFRLVAASDRAAGFAFAFAGVFAFEDLVVAALVAEALAFVDLVEAVALDLVALVAAPALFAARLAVLVAAVVVTRVPVVAVFVAVVLAAAVSEVAAFLFFVDLVLAAVVLPVVVFLVAPLLPLAAFDDVFRVELVEVFAVGFAAEDGAACFEVREDTVVRDRLAADTLLRPAESAGDTATQTPALLRKRNSCLAWEAGMRAFSHTPRTSCALTWPDS